MKFHRLLTTFFLQGRLQQLLAQFFCCNFFPSTNTVHTLSYAVETFQLISNWTFYCSDSTRPALTSLYSIMEHVEHKYLMYRCCLTAFVRRPRPKVFLSFLAYFRLLYDAEWNSMSKKEKWKYGTKISFFSRLARYAHNFFSSPVEYCVSDIYGFFMLNLVKLESWDLLCCHIANSLRAPFELWLMHSMHIFSILQFEHETFSISMTLVLAFYPIEIITSGWLLRSCRFEWLRLCSFSPSSMKNIVHRIQFFLLTSLISVQETFF